MSLAKVRVLNTNEIITVEVKKIVNFHKYLEHPSVNEFYILKDKGRKQSVSILHTADTEERLLELLEEHRLRLATFNQSEIIDESDKSDEEKETKSDRKTHQENRKRCENIQSTEIINKYNRKQKVHEDECEKEQKKSKANTENVVKAYIKSRKGSVKKMNKENIDTNLQEEDLFSDYTDDKCEYSDADLHKNKTTRLKESNQKSTSDTNDNDIDLDKNKSTLLQKSYQKSTSDSNNSDTDLDKNKTTLSKKSNRQRILDSENREVDLDKTKTTLSEKSYRESIPDFNDSDTDLNKNKRTLPKKSNRLKNQDSNDSDTDLDKNKTTHSKNSSGRKVLDSIAFRKRSINSISQYPDIKKKKKSNPQSLDLYRSDADLYKPSTSKGLSGTYSSRKKIKCPSTDSDSSDSSKMTKKTYEELLKENKRLKKKLKQLQQQDIFSTTERKIDLGYGYEIKREALQTAWDKPDASKVVITLAYAIFGYELLSESSVNGQKRPALNKDGVMVIKGLFRKWLHAKELPDRVIDRELQRVNEYLGSAITGAMRHLKSERNKKM